MSDDGRTTWADIREYVQYDADVLDADGNTWRATYTDRLGRRQFARTVDGDIKIWTPKGHDIVLLPTPPIPEPPDGTRIEFEHATDVYAAWRHDDSGRAAGWKVGDGGANWVLYGSSVPVTWAAMWAMFGDALTKAVRLIPAPEDAHLRDQWPTAIYRRKQISREQN